MSEIGTKATLKGSPYIRRKAYVDPLRVDKEGAPMV